MVSLEGDLAAASADSAVRARLWSLEIEKRDQQIAWLEDRLPRWYEKPAFVAGATAIVVIYAVLKAVRIGLS